MIHAPLVPICINIQFIFFISKPQRLHHLHSTFILEVILQQQLYPLVCPGFSLFSASSNLCTVVRRSVIQVLTINWPRLWWSSENQCDRVAEVRSRQGDGIAQAVVRQTFDLMTMGLNVNDQSFGRQNNLHMYSLFFHGLWNDVWGGKPM